MYEIIGINYERNNDTPSIIRRQGRTPEILNEVYEHGKSLWESGACSKYLVALIKSGKMMDYNRPDYWGFKNKNMYDEETSHFPTWDYNENSCPYTDRKYHEGEAHDFMILMCRSYQEILKDEGAL